MRLSLSNKKDCKHRMIRWPMLIDRSSHSTQNLTITILIETHCSSNAFAHLLNKILSKEVQTRHWKDGSATLTNSYVSRSMSYSRHSVWCFKETERWVVSTKACNNCRRRLLTSLAAETKSKRRCKKLIY